MNPNNRLDAYELIRDPLFDKINSKRNLKPVYINKIILQ